MFPSSTIPLANERFVAYLSREGSLQKLLHKHPTAFVVLGGAAPIMRWKWVRDGTEMLPHLSWKRKGEQNVVLEAQTPDAVAVLRYQWRDAHTLELSWTLEERMHGAIPSLFQWEFVGPAGSFWGNGALWNRGWRIAPSGNGSEGMVWVIKPSLRRVEREEGAVVAQVEARTPGRKRTSEGALRLQIAYAEGGRAPHLRKDPSKQMRAAQERLSSRLASLSTPAPVRSLIETARIWLTSHRGPNGAFHFPYTGVPDPVVSAHLAYLLLGDRRYTEAASTAAAAIELLPRAPESAQLQALGYLAAYLQLAKSRRTANRIAAVFPHALLRKVSVDRISSNVSRLILLGMALTAGEATARWEGGRSFPLECYRTSLESVQKKLFSLLPSVSVREHASVLEGVAVGVLSRADHRVQGVLRRIQEEAQDHNPLAAVLSAALLGETATARQALIRFALELPSFPSDPVAAIATSRWVWDVALRCWGRGDGVLLL